MGGEDELVATIINEGVVFVEYGHSTVASKLGD